MDNEPEYHGHHTRWSYHSITKFLKKSDYRISSIAHEIRQTKKERNKDK